MSLQIWRASEEQLADHLANCEKPCCPTCAGIVERQDWYREIQEDERLAREAEQNAEYDEFERAEIARDMECGDWTSEDLREGEPGR